ncbi:hypothetical protein BHE74_00025929, partial [Ensete ventricosum]
VNFPGFPGFPVGYMVPSVAYSTISYGSNGSGGKYPSNKVSGARIKISDRGDFVSGTSDR